MIIDIYLGILEGGYTGTFPVTSKVDFRSEMRMMSGQVLHEITHTHGNDAFVESLKLKAHVRFKKLMVCLG